MSNKPWKLYTLYSVMITFITVCNAEATLRPAIREIDPTTPLTNYISLGEWNSNGDFEGWAIGHYYDSNDVAALAVYGGSITGRVTGGDLWIRKNQSFNISSGTVIEIKCRYDENTANTNQYGEYYLYVDGWQNVRFAVGDEIPIDGQFHVYRTTLTDPNFSGKTILMRIDQLKGTETIGETFEIDYVRICPKAPEGENEFTLWQLPSQQGSQMESYVMKTAQGKLIVIDGGYTSDGPYLKEFLSRHGNYVDSWFITHPHSDHIGALTWILSNQGNLTIDKIYTAFPPLGWVQTNEAGTVNTIVDFNTALTNACKRTVKMNAEEAYDVDKVHIEILYVVDLAITNNAINNSSAIIKIFDQTKSVLFLGDCGFTAGTNILATVNTNKLRADYVQMAHHGQAGVGESFYQTVQPKYCLWPTPLWLWNNDNGGGYNSGPWLTLIVRQWMEELNVITNYVSGFSDEPMMVFTAYNYSTAIPAAMEIDPATALDNYISFGEWNTDGNFEGWDGTYSLVQITNAAVHDGNLTGMVTGADMSIRKDFAYGSRPYLFNGDIVEIRCKYNENTETTGGNYYFHTDGWAPVDFLTGTAFRDGKFHVYRTTITEDKGVTILCRVDMLNGAACLGETFEIDYIRMKSSIMVDPTETADKHFAYTSLAEWNTPGDFENWTIKDSSNVVVANGYFSGSSSGANCQIIKNNAVNLPQIDLEQNKIVEIRMRRNSSDNGVFNLFYGTTNCPGACGAARVELTGSSMPQDGFFHIYRFDMSNEANWKGALETLGIKITNLNGTDYDIDYIRIGKIMIPEPVTLGMFVLFGVLFLRKE